MANRKHEPSLAGVRMALPFFDVYAPIGTYQIDALFSDNPKSVHRARLLFKDTVMMALLRERHGIEFPKSMQAADAFFMAIRAAKEAMGRFDAGEIASVVVLSEPLDSDGRSLDPESEYEQVIEKTEDVMLAIGQTIDTYLAEVWRPEFINSDKGSNRTIRFDHYLVECVARSWRELYGRAIASADLNQITALVGAAMRDFDYPAPKPEVLRDRIRKHRVWK